MDSWTGYLVGLPPSWVYGALCLLLVLEGTGLPFVPFEPAFLTAGLMIRGGKMSFWGTLLACTVAHLLGNLGGYWAGRRLGASLLHLHGFRLGLSRERLELARVWLQRRGGWATLISRFVGLLRTPAILGAGALGMDLRVYTAWSLLAGFLWSLAWLGGAVVIGAPLMDYLDRLGLWGLALLILAGAALLVWHFGWRRRGRGH
jgi:membrane protein DedA with SNARE-associated domain